jgi:hypothetical protein
MNMSLFRGAVILTALTLGAGALSSCHSTPPPPAPAAAPQAEAAYAPSTGAILYNGPTRTGDSSGTTGALLRVKNRLNRSISIDILGHGHGDANIGDGRTEALALTAGDHTLSISAAGLKPAKFSFHVERGEVYEVEIYRRNARD